MIAGTAGCGGESSSGDELSSHSDTYDVEADTTMTTAANLDQAEFLARTEEICRRAWKPILKNFAEYSSWQHRKMPERKRFVEAVQLTLLASIDFYIFDEIYNLGAPKGEERETEEIIGTMQSAVERGQKKLEPIASVAQIVNLFDEYNRRASRYGLSDECLVDEPHLRPIEA
jgi:hypothetical protein